MADALQLDVSGGRIEGAVRRGLRMWRGIPYAAPPIGDLRLRAPQPVVPWEGIRPARDFGPVAPQDPRSLSGTNSRAAMSEDCLTLNVIAPRIPSAVPRPVMVYIHGGAYAVGSSREMPEQGEGLVHDGGVVFVNLNYRLGALGYLDFTRYSSPDRPFDSNLGLRDQLAALEWVRDNIGAFGGDPGNVTLFGESAGANAVTTLMAVPRAHGLFARAIAESSPAEAVYDPDITALWARDFLELLGAVRRAPLTSEPTAEEAARLLGEATTAQFVAATTRLVREMPDRVPGSTLLAPVADGELLPMRPVDAFREGRAARIPLIIGTNEREGSLFRGRLDILASTPARIRAVFAKTPREEATAIARMYPRLSRRPSSADFAGDYSFWYPSVRIAEAHARHAPVYFYRFDIAPRLARWLGLDATHGIELFAVFDQARKPPGRLFGLLGGYRAFERVGRRMRTNWLRFAFSGQVDAGWPRYDAEHRRTLIIDVDDRVEEDPRSELRRAWAGFVPHLFPK
ncbi:carboxylesterase/lipase family protein [Pseudolysinimonas kribbensis]|uniref:carboxylesterase/lipase family protein n=1 Tax=Pseudolysinimonas kribbensis TaxID=433641 RepID=UPI0031DAB403